MKNTDTLAFTFKTFLAIGKKKKELKICDRSKIIVNHTEWKFTQRGIKSYEKILGELQNKRKKEKENKKTTICSKSGETLNSVKKTELDYM